MYKLYDLMNVRVYLVVQFYSWYNLVFPFPFLIGRGRFMFYPFIVVVDSLLSAKKDGDSLGLLQNRYGWRIPQSVSF